MIDITPEIANLGALGIIVLFTIKEGFSYLKSRKYPNHSDNDKAMLSEMKATVTELKLMNENHLNTICHTIGSGNKEIVKAITEMSDKLGGRLDNIADNTSRLVGRSDK